MSSWSFVLVCWGLAAVLFLMKNVRPVWVWAAFFATYGVITALKPSPFQFFFIVFLVAMLCWEKFSPRSEIVPEDDRVHRKLGYTVLLLSTFPLIFIFMGYMGLRQSASLIPGFGLQACGVPLWLQSIILLVLIDLEKYWLHRWQHKFSFWWKVHRIHHIYRGLSVASYAPGHMIEYLLIQAFCMIGLSVLVGAHPDALFYGYIVPGIMVASSLWAHANIDCPRMKTPWWAYVIVTPNAHAMHHTEELDRYNFGSIFIFWDIMFGTYRCPVANRNALSKMGVSNEEPANGFWKEQLLQTKLLK